MSATIPDLRARLGDLPTAERRRFLRRIAGAERIGDPARRDRVVALLGREIEAARARATRRAALAPKEITYPADLPITARRDDLLQTIRDHQVVVVAGETGRGRAPSSPRCASSWGVAGIG